MKWMRLLLGCITQTGGRRDEERERGRVFPLSAGFHFHIKRRLFSLSNSPPPPSPHLHHPLLPPPPLVPGSRSLRVCSANVQRALFPLTDFSLSYAICISVGVETDDRLPIETRDEQGEELFHSPTMLMSTPPLPLPPTPLTFKPSLD